MEKREDEMSRPKGSKNKNKVAAKAVLKSVQEDKVPKIGDIVVEAANNVMGKKHKKFNINHIFQILKVNSLLKNPNELIEIFHDLEKKSVLKQIGGAWWAIA